MYQSLKKGFLMATVALGLASVAKADKGMWLLNELTKENVQKMKELGFKLPVDSLYNLNKPSIANSVVIFGRGCTGVTVSQQGLVMTNHHCGYDAIQSQSTVDHDYLRDGFVSQSFGQELPIAGLTVKYLSEIKDVTKTLLSNVGITTSESERQQKIQSEISSMIASENKTLKNKHKEVTIVPYYAGNSYYMITYDVFTDVRMVFAPPSAIGKYGGDTDNWMYPRHTGDFSVFRVYASKDNKPADYSKDNVPYKPKYVAAVSTNGYQEGDYSMTIGFPGSTERYIPSWGIENRMENENAPRIEVRGIKQAIWRRAMDANQDIRIKYSSKYASSSNYWKNAIGMNRGLKRLNVLDRKRAEEESYNKWVKSTDKTQYDVLGDLAKSYKSAGNDTRYLTYTYEALIGGTEVLRFALNLNGFNTNVTEYINSKYKDYVPNVDRQVLPAMLDIIRERLPKQDTKEIFDVIDKEYKGDTKAYANSLFDKSVVPYKDKLLALVNSGKLAQTLEKDPIVLLADKVQTLWRGYSQKLANYEYAIERGNRLYFAGRKLMSPSRLMPSDANFTMRMSYGSVKGYNPADAANYLYYTTPKGIIEKYDPESTEFNLPSDFLNLLKKGDWGRWADKKKKTLLVNFIATNDITGGNSGSPMFDKNGRLIGLAFDGNWEAMSGDIEFEPELQRTIGVDIRYVLFVIDKWGKCPRLVQELDLR